MTDKQRQKHIADREPKPIAEGSSLDAAEPTPDGLGTWEGGTAALKGVNSWVSLKSAANAKGDNKHATGTEYASKITHRQDQDFNEIHTDANGDFWLYNVKTDAWDILGDEADIPFYHDVTKSEMFAFNCRTGAWDVPVEAVEPPDTVEDHGDVISNAVA
jgi:hypothetical protein